MGEPWDNGPFSLAAHGGGVTANASADARPDNSFFSGPDNDALVFATGLESLPASLLDTAAPGNLRLDAQGNLVLDPSLRALFDYFLTAQGEEPFEVVTARIRAYLRHSLPPPAAGQSEKILDQYLEYLAALADIPDPGGVTTQELSPALIAQRKELERMLRSRYLAPDVADVFFGAEDQYDSYALSLLELRRDTTLGEVDKEVQRQLLLAQLPEDLQAQLRRDLGQASTRDAIQKLRQEFPLGGADERIRSLRVQQWGESAAQRLAQVDRAQRGWKQRSDEYLEQRQALLDNRSLGGPERDQMIDQLRASHFVDSELRRVESYERLHDSGELERVR